MTKTDLSKLQAQLAAAAPRPNEYGELQGEKPKVNPRIATSAEGQAASVMLAFLATDMDLSPQGVYDEIKKGVPMLFRLGAWTCPSAC